MNRFVSQGSRLHDYSHPTSGFNRAERIKITVPLEMPALALVDLADQPFVRLWRRRYGIWFEIAGKKRHPVLVEHLKKEPV